MNLEENIEQVDTKPVNKQNVEIVDKSSSKSNYFENKERNKIKTKIKRIEADIEKYENRIEELKTEMQKPENCTNYTKLAGFQKEIDDINEKLENKMIEWEELNSSIDE